MTLEHDDIIDEKLSIKINTSIETFITPEFNYLLAIYDRLKILKMFARVGVHYKYLNLLTQFW